MTEIPYTPPVPGGGDFEIGACLSDAWSSTWDNFPLWLGVGLVWLLATFLAAATIIGLLLIPVLSWGFTRFFLRMHDGEAEFGDAFSGFSRFGEVFVPMIVLGSIFVALSFAAQSVQFWGASIDNPAISFVGMLVIVGFQFLVAPRLTFAFFYLVDQDLSGTEALSRAWTETEPVKWKALLLALMAYPIMLAGALALVVGLIPAVVIYYLMYVSAYRQLTGAPAPA